VAAVLDQRRRQFSELKVRVSGAEERAAGLRQRADTADDDRRCLEQQLNSMKDQQQHMSVIYTYIQLEVHGRARREAARRHKSKCKINLSPR